MCTDYKKTSIHLRYEVQKCEKEDISDKESRRKKVGIVKKENYK